MANNFFELVSDSFFNPFVNKNKRLNYDLLKLLNDKMSLDNLSVVKEDIVSWMLDYLENCPINLHDNETDEVLDNKTFCYNQIRYFVKCGWLVEDYDGLKVTYQLDENGIKLLDTMDNIVKEDTKTLEFSGFVYNIYNNLYNFRFDHSVDIVEQVYASSKELNSMLRGLNVNIKKYLTKLISENGNKPKEVLNTLFYEYYKKVVVKAFKNFREKDNPSKYKLYIENKIDDLLEDINLDSMINNYINVKYDGVKNEDNLIEAKEFYTTRLEYISQQFEDIEDYINMLNKKNTKYISTSQSRLNFLLNEETDIEGRIIEVLKGLEYTNEEFFLDSYFNLYSKGNLDGDSLYKPVSRKTKTKSLDSLEDFVFDEEEIKKNIDKLFKDNQYSINSINEFVFMKLNGNTKIYASSIKIKDFNELLKLFLVKIYFANSLVNYNVEELEKNFKVLGYRLNDFIIEVK